MNTTLEKLVLAQQEIESLKIKLHAACGAVVESEELAADYRKRFDSAAIGLIDEDSTGGFICVYPATIKDGDKLSDWQIPVKKGKHREVYIIPVHEEKPATRIKTQPIPGA